MLEESKEIIREYVDVAPETIKENSGFTEDLGLNSHDFMSVVGEIEERFDVEVEEREVVNTKTVRDAADYTQSLQAEWTERREEDMAAGTLRDVIRYDVEAHGEQTAFRYKIKKEITDGSYNEVNLDSMAVSRAVGALGMKRKHIAVIGITSYQQITAYFGIVNSGSVAVSIDAQFPAEIICELLNRADVEMLVYDELRPDVAGNVREKCPGIRHAVSMQVQETAGDVFLLSRLIAESAGTYETKLSGGQLCTIPSTSGTTRKSKGVMLSHRNLMDNAVCLDMKIPAGTVFMTLLPINHVYCLITDIIKGLYIGMTICINDSIMRVQRNMKLFKPEIVLLVSLVIKSIYGKLKNVESLISKRMAAKATFGDNLRTIYSGGACLDPDYVDRFKEYGVTILQGYGTTECSPVISTNLEWENKKGSVGKFPPSCEAKVMDEEIWIRGSSVMQGYYKMPEWTAETLEDEWFKTGDLGCVDEDNFVYIAGRHRNLTILANGENASPEELENELSHSELAKEILVREKDKIIEAGVFPDYEYAKKKHVKDIRGTPQELIDGFNKDMPIYGRIYSLIVRETEFEETPSKKIKRFQNVYSM